MERQTSNLSNPAESATTATANVPNATPYDVTTDVLGIRTLFINVFFGGAPGKGNPWTLIDAESYGYANPVRERAEQLYGAEVCR